MKHSRELLFSDQRVVFTGESKIGTQWRADLLAHCGGIGGFGVVAEKDEDAEEDHIT